MRELPVFPSVGADEILDIFKFDRKAVLIRSQKLPAHSCLGQNYTPTLRLCPPSFSSPMFLVCRICQRKWQSPLALPRTCLIFLYFRAESLLLSSNSSFLLGTIPDFSSCSSPTPTGDHTFFSIEKTKLIKHKAPISTQISSFTRICQYKHLLIFLSSFRYHGLVPIIFFHLFPFLLSSRILLLGLNIGQLPLV